MKPHALLALLLFSSSVFANPVCRAPLASGAETPRETGGVVAALTFAPDSSNFCSRPADAICDSPTTDDTARARAIEQVKQTAISEGLMVTAMRFGRNPLVFTPDAILREPMPARAQMIQMLQAEVTTRLSQTIAQADIDGVIANVGKIRGYLLTAIDRNFAPGTAENTLLRARINSVRVMTPELLAAMPFTSQKADYAALEQTYVEGCGPTGLEDNAFATRPINGNRYLIVCPGNLLAAARDGNDVEGSYFRNLVFTVGHELGHQIDVSEYPGLYTNFLGCLEQNHAAELNGPLVNHQREITADYWGSETLTDYLWENVQRTTPEQRLRVLREAGGALCNSGDEGIHPAATFRFTQLVRGNPHLAVTMGCDRVPMPDGKPSCNLRGASRPGDVTLLPIPMPVR